MSWSYLILKLNVSTHFWIDVTGIESKWEAEKVTFFMLSTFSCRAYKGWKTSKTSLETDECGFWKGSDSTMCQDKVKFHIMWLFSSFCNWHKILECNIDDIYTDFTLGEMAYVAFNGVKASAGDLIFANIWHECGIRGP